MPDPLPTPRLFLMIEFCKLVTFAKTSVAFVPHADPNAFRRPSINKLVTRTHIYTQTHIYIFIYCTYRVREREINRI